MLALNALLGSLLFTLPEVIVIALLSIGIALLFYNIRTLDERNAQNSMTFVSFRPLVQMTVVFGLFGYVLGTFTGMTGQSLATTVVGTISTTAATYLAYLYSKDTLANTRVTIASSLAAFFVAIPLSVQYVTHYGT